MTLRTKASLLISFIIIVIMGVSGIYYLHFLQRSLQTSILAGVEGVANTTSQAISKFLVDSLKETQAVALALPVEALEKQETAVIRNRLQALWQIFSKFENGMFILDKNGRLWVDYPPSDVGGTDFSYREYFQRTLKEGQGIVGIPYVSGRTGKPVLTFTALLRGSDNQVLGVLGCSVQMLSPTALGGIRSVKIGRSGYIFVYNTSRMMILHPENERVMKFDIPPGANKLLDDALAGHEVVGETVNSRGVPMLSAFKRIPGTDWIIAAQQPQSEAYSPIARARTWLILGIIAVVIVAVASVALAIRRITDPLTKLRQAVMFFGREESRESQRVTQELEKIRGSDEIGDLARAFLEISKKLDKTLISLKRANIDWERTFNTVPDLIAIIDRQHNIVKINQAMGDRFGITPPEAVGLKCHQLFHGSDQPITACPHKKTIDDGQEHVEEVAEERLGGIFLITTSPLRDQEGELLGSLHMARDITELKRAQEERLRFSKLESLGTLAGGIAHDFNNILTVILGNIGLAVLDDQVGPKASQRLAQAEQACLRAQTLSRQLLTFAKGGAPIKKIISLPKLLEETAALTLSGSKSRGALLIPADLWPVAADEGQISQVISNLLINADQAMPEGGVINIGAENILAADEPNLPMAEGKFVKLTFTDAGTGIPAKYLDRIFDPYFSTKQKGSGLGLATAYSIIRNHHGHIAVESILGRGTTFLVYLPAREQQVMQPVQEKRKLFSGKGKILVMDDEEMVRQVLETMLAELGYQVRVAKDGVEALALFDQASKSGEPFGGVILDLTIPGGMGGKETMARLLQLNPQVKGIVSSGYSDDPIMADFQKYGFAAVIAKPYRISELGKVLKEALPERNG